MHKLLEIKTREEKLLPYLVHKLIDNSILTYVRI